MGSIPTKPSESARRTSPRLGVAGLKGLPTLVPVFVEGCQERCPTLGDLNISVFLVGHGFFQRF